MDTSDRAAIIAFGGTPDASRVARAPGGYAPYRALGYDCREKEFDGGWPIARSGPWCQTVFFLDERTGKLETFYTASAKYVESHGVHVGMKQSEAERRVHRVVRVGCTAAWHFDSPTGSLSIQFGGGTLSGLTVKGAHVEAIVVHSKRQDAGVFDCL